MQALAAMPHGPIARDTRERATREAPCNYYVQYDALSCASLWQKFNLIAIVHVNVKKILPHTNLTRDFCQSYCCPSPEMQPVHTNWIPRTSCTSLHGGYAVVVHGNNFYISLTIQLKWTAVTTFDFISTKKLTMTTDYISGTKGLWNEWSMVRMVYTWYE